MTEIALEGMHFYAYHGYYSEERELGGEYIIHARITIDDFDSFDDTLKETVNYEQIYSACQDHMLQKYKLIETLGLHIASDIKALSTEIHSVKVTVEKLNPPIQGKIDKAVVTITL